MLPPPTHDSMAAQLARFLNPGSGWCGRCGMPWKFSEGHTTWEATDQDHTFAERGSFPLCEHCWGKLTIEERLPYYERHLSGGHEPESSRRILESVKAGL